MKRLILFLLVIVLALSTGVAFGQSSDLGSIDPSGQTIVYWHQYSEGSAQGDTIATLIQQFNDTNEWGITVQGLYQGSYNEMRDLMNAAIISGELPNIVAGYQNDAASYALDNVVVDLNPYVNDSKWGFTSDEMDNLNQGVMAVNIFNSAPYNGAMLAWPNQISANTLAVNMTVLNALGYDKPPETFDDFMAVACAAANSDLTGANDVAMRGYPIKADSSNFESMLAGRGGRIFDYSTDSYDFTTPEAIATFQMYHDLYANNCGYIPDSAYGNTDDFALGINPMALGSSAGIPFIKSGFENSGVTADWVTTTTPWTEGNQAIQVYVPSVMIIQGTPEQNLAAWLFMKWLTGTDPQVTWSTNTGYFTINREAASQVQAAVQDSNPQLASVIGILNDPDVTVYTSPNIVSYGTVRGLVSTAVADVTANGKDVNEVAQQLTDDANAAQADAMASQ